MPSHLSRDLNHATIALFEIVHSSPNTSRFTYYFVFPALSLMFNALIQPSIPTQQNDSAKHIFKIKLILKCFAEMKWSYTHADTLCWTGFSYTRELTCQRHLGEEPSSSSFAFMLKCVACEVHRVFYNVKALYSRRRWLQSCLGFAPNVMTQPDIIFCIFWILSSWFILNWSLKGSYDSEDLSSQ